MQGQYSRYRSPVRNQEKSLGLSSRAAAVSAPDSGGAVFLWFCCVKFCNSFWPALRGSA
jgi:hypothetical protein